MKIVHDKKVVFTTPLSAFKDVGKEFVAWVGWVSPKITLNNFSSTPNSVTNNDQSLNEQPRT